MKPHKHAELIKAWADGAEIEARDLRFSEYWHPCENPQWYSEVEYRIKPEPKPEVVFYRRDVVFYRRFDLIENTKLMLGGEGIDNLKLIFDGETGELKSAEVLK